MSEIQVNSNYINVDARVLTVYFVLNFDDKYVRGFRWNYLNNKHTGFRMLRSKFEQRYVLSPVQ